MNKEMNKEEKEQKYALLHMLDEQLRQTQKQIKNLQRQQESLAEGIHALDEIKGAELGAEILVPITGGVFVKATLTEKEKVTVNIGAQTAVQKSREDTVHLLETQFREVESVLSQLTNDLKELYTQAKNLEDELAKHDV